MAEVCKNRIAEEMVTKSTSNSAKERASYLMEAEAAEETINILIAEREVLARQDDFAAEQVSWETLASNCAEFQDFRPRIEKAVDDLRILLKAATEHSTALASSAPRLRADFDRYAFAEKLPRLVRERLEGIERNPITGKPPETIEDAFREFIAMTLWFGKASEESNRSQPMQPAAE